MIETVCKAEVHSEIYIYEGVRKGFIEQVGPQFSTIGFGELMFSPAKAVLFFICCKRVCWFLCYVVN